jgi:hypothetical protein
MSASLRRNLFKRQYLVLLMIFVTLLACRCNTFVLTSCEMAYGEGNGGDCYNRYEAMCPEGMPALEARACEAAFLSGQEYVYSPAPAPSNPQQSQIVAPPSSMACDFLRLTAPLDGLPNGGTTFYWDPIPNATGYNISLFDGGSYLAGYNAPAGSTNLGADVSQGAIGGGYSITIVLTATGPNGQTCTTGATVFRAAPDGGSQNNDSNNAPSQPVPTEEVDDCVQNPVPSCIH